MLPDATWGRITIEDAQLAWGAAEAHRLQLVCRLRELGIGSRMLRAAAPPFTVLATASAQVFTEVMAAWSELDPWRSSDNPWMTLALHITLPTKEDR